MNARYRVNEQDIQFALIGTDGREEAGNPSTEELTWIARADRLLRSSMEFLRRYPGARLMQVESYRGVPDTTRGRLYLRYASRQAGAVDVWAHLHEHDLVDVPRSLVTLAAGVAVAGSTPE